MIYVTVEQMKERKTICSFFLNAIKTLVYHETIVSERKNRKKGERERERAKDESKTDRERERDREKEQKMKKLL